MLQNYLSPQAYQSLQKEKAERALSKWQVAEEIAEQPPHSEEQRKLIEFPGNVVAFCGRRWGKTDGNVRRIYYWLRRNPGLYWWVGLSWKSASMKRAWREINAIARNVLAAKGLDERSYINRSRYEVILPGLGEIWFRTADNPPSLAGEGIRGAVLDEFALMAEIVWSEYVQATLLDYGGWASFSGVPKGNNWAANLWRNAAGLDGWLQLHATSYDNPFIDSERIDKIRGETSEMIFNQEYMAQIVDMSGGVFRRINEAATAQEQLEPEEDHQYIAGVDVASLVDFTVVIVMDVTSGEMAYMDRFNRVDYSVLEDRLEAVYKRFNLDLMTIEDNSIGQGVVDHLRNRGLAINTFTTTNATKHSVITNLQSAFEHGRIKILDDPVLIGELQAFEAKRNNSGTFSYSAPDGMHDDCVMALAIVWQGIDGGNWWLA